MSTLHVTAPSSALVEGILREDTSIADLFKLGDFGLGTLNNLDGEMIILDGEAFRIDVEGIAHPVDKSELTPFACVTRFQPGTRFTLSDVKSYEDFLATLTAHLVSKNYMYALKITGTFDQIKTRSVPKQSSNRPLVDVAHEQKETELFNADGTLVGFWAPTFLSSVTVAGFHFHFLTVDKGHGGHLMGCEPKNLIVEIQEIHRLDLELPSTPDFSSAKFDRDASADLKAAEH